MAGRPPKISEEIIDEICKAKELGAPDKICAYYADIDKTTLVAWKNQGKIDLEKGIETLYSKLIKQLKKVKARALIKRLELLNKYEKETWQVICWRLEREYPEYFGKKERHEIANPKGESFLLAHGEDVNPKELTNEQLEQIMQQIKQKMLEDKGE